MDKKDKPEAPQPLIATAEPLSEEDKEWLKFYAEEQRKSPVRYEEAAKYLTGIISICLTIFIDKKPPNLQSWTVDALTLASGFWVVAAIMTFIVLLPMKYHYNDQSPESIQRMHQQIVDRKRNLLIASMVLFFVGMLIGVYAFMQGYEFKK